MHLKVTIEDADGSSAVIDNEVGNDVQRIAAMLRNAASKPQRIEQMVWTRVSESPTARTVDATKIPAAVKEIVDFIVEALPQIANSIETGNRSGSVEHSLAIVFRDSAAKVPRMLWRLDAVVGRYQGGN